MLRCASSFVVAAYVYVRLTPQDSRALPAELFTEPPNLACFSSFYEFINPGLPAQASRWQCDNRSGHYNGFAEKLFWGT